MFIMSHIEHSSHVDEGRFVTIISSLIADGEVSSYPAWEKGLKDVKGRKARKKAGEKEALEAEKAAMELGVHDEFFGSGKAGKRRGKGKGQASNGDGKDGEDDDMEALRAMILKKPNRLDALADSLALKYASSSKGNKRRPKKRAADDDDDAVEEAPKRRRKAV